MLHMLACACGSACAPHQGCSRVPELKEAAEATQARYRSEKQRRQQVEARVSSLEEELQDVKIEKGGLERVRERSLSLKLLLCIIRVGRVETPRILSISPAKDAPGEEEEVAGGAAAPGGGDGGGTQQQPAGAGEPVGSASQGPEQH